MRSPQKYAVQYGSVCSEKITFFKTISECQPCTGQRIFAEVSSYPPTDKPWVIIQFFHGWGANFTGDSQLMVDDMFGKADFNLKLLLMRGNDFGSLSRSNGRPSWNVNGIGPDSAYGLGAGQNFAGVNGGSCENPPGPDEMDCPCAGEDCPCKTNPKPKFCGCAWTSCSPDIDFANTVFQHYAQLRPRVVCAAGFSNGALFALRLASEPHSAVTHVVSFAGGVPYKLYTPRKNLPFIDFHGRSDTTIPGVTSAKDSQCSDHSAVCDSSSQKYRYANLSDVIVEISGNATGTTSNPPADDASETSYGPVISIEFVGGHETPYDPKKPISSEATDIIFRFLGLK